MGPVPLVCTRSFIVIAVVVIYFPRALPTGNPAALLCPKPPWAGMARTLVKSKPDGEDVFKGIQDATHTAQQAALDGQLDRPTAEKLSLIHI